MPPAIVVENLGKQFQLGERHPLSLRELFSSSWRGRGARRGQETFWALQALSFAVQAGAVLGVVGRNGAGKSTLLKVLSRISAPTTGRVTVRGRLASLLEVGTGFHPELTGRENIYLNGSILGMRRREIASRFDAIVAFAEVERFLDTPVKRYSSGMYVRLAFAVAAHLEPDVLLIDEVLAVGDAEFQKRCLGKMNTIAKAGRTVLFVSHNLTALRQLCTHGLWLEHGRLQALGPMAEVLGQYGAQGRIDRNTVEIAATSARTADIALIRRVAVLPKDAAAISVATGFVIRVEFEVRAPALDVGVFLHCHHAEQGMAFSSGSFFEKSLNGLTLNAGRHEFECEVPARLLNDGDYTLDVLLVKDRRDVLAAEQAVLAFRVHDADLGVEGWHWRPAGIVRPVLAWRHRRRSVAPSLEAQDYAELSGR